MSTKTITQRGWVYFDTFRAKWNYPEAERFRFVGGDKLDLGESTVPVCEATISFEVPADFDHREPQIAALQAKKRALQAEFAKRVTEIEREISELQALEFTPA